MRTSGYKPKPRRGDGVITALKARKGVPDRVAVCLDGATPLDLAAVVVERAGLYPGLYLTADAQERLQEQDAPYRARSRSLRLLAFRDRSEFEMESRLRAAGFDAEVAQDAVRWLRGLGYLDDDRFAMRYAAERIEAGWGKRRVQAELSRKGLDREVIARALETAGEAVRAATGEEDRVVAAANRRFGAQFASDPEAAERKLAGYLARRGYDWEEIGRVVRAVRSEVGVGSGTGEPLP